MAQLSRGAYAHMFGPTTGDRVRLADTGLLIEVERDLTTYGEEVKFGGGKMIRDGMGQSQTSQAEGAADTIITNALILDHWGIVKADVAITNGRISGIGKAGNPEIQPGVDIVIGPGTEIIAGEGKILTAGGIEGLPVERRVRPAIQISEARSNNPVLSAGRPRRKNPPGEGQIASTISRLSRSNARIACRAATASAV